MPASRGEGVRNKKSWQFLEAIGHFKLHCVYRIFQQTKLPKWNEMSKNNKTWSTFICSSFQNHYKIIKSSKACHGQGDMIFQARWHDLNKHAGKSHHRLMVMDAGRARGSRLEGHREKVHFEEPRVREEIMCILSRKAITNAWQNQSQFATNWLSYVRR